MSDLFAEVRERDLERLRQLGWTLDYRWGTHFWLNPATKAFYSEQAALAWLHKQDERVRVSEDDGQPE